MALLRYRVGMGNWVGAPGVITHYFSTTITDFTAVRAMYVAIANLFPNGLQFTFPTLVDVINETNGQLQSSQATGAQSAVTSSATTTFYSAATGALIRWNTSGVVHGNKVVGRTFLVPIISGAFTNTGVVAGATITTAQTAANALLAAYGDGLKVWARPFAGRTGVPGKPDIPARVGSFFTALSATVPSTPVVLRSRRI